MPGSTWPKSTPDTNNYPKAARAFALAYDLSDPKEADYLYYSAVMTLMEGKAGAASKIFERLFAAHPEKVTLKWRETYANALMRAEYWKKAVPVVRTLARETTGKEKIRWQETLLQIYLTMDDLKRARIGPHPWPGKPLNWPGGGKPWSISI